MNSDQLQEILHTIAKSPLRTFLTSLAVGWGIFMLVILLAAGQGLENGVKGEFKDSATNGIWVNGGQTSVPHNGLQPGRYIQFDNDDYEEIKNSLPYVQAISAEFAFWRSNTVTYKQESGSFTIRAVHPEYQHIEFREMLEGRFLNQLDIDEQRKVAIIGSAVRDALFKETPALGKQIIINGNAFTVAGIFQDKLSQFSAGRIYLPISTAQKLISGTNKVNEIMLTTDYQTAAENEVVANTIRKMLARKHDFALDDQRAIGVNNALEQYEMFTSLFWAIEIFVWIIGGGTLIAGIVGVSNIMMVVVKERTKEIGIRKAIGATPFNITSQIVLEAVLITSVSGYIGMVLGVGLVELTASFLPDEMPYFQNPEINLRIVLMATAMLVISGALAGYFPARNAAGIRPIEALREE